MKNRYTLFGLVGLGIVLGLWLAQPAHAQIYVTTTDDELNTDGDCSLREAVQAANTNSAVDNCIDKLKVYDTIVLDVATYTLSILGFNENGNKSGDLDITEDVTIQGAGIWKTVINAAYIDDRALHILRGFVVLRDLTITDGSTNFGNGGCIHVNEESSLVLERVAISGCLARDSGGGIYVAPKASLSIYGSKIEENGAGGSGGGIFVANHARLSIIENTTIHNNYANKDGGGIFNVGTIDSIYNTTISLNRARDSGGGIRNGSSGVIGKKGGAILNTTISGNSADSGGGIFNAGQIYEVIHVTIAYNEAFKEGGGIHNVSGGSFWGIRSSIIANSLKGGDCSNTGSISSQGYNILSDGSCIKVFTNIGDLLNTDPMLGPLQNNGGPTETHALLPGSPAIDHVEDKFCPDTDQRGVMRPIDGDGDGIARCDSGAFEFKPGVIRGFKWLDIDGDGHKASYEPFLRGITIRVTGTDVWGNPINLSAVTDAQGQFIFANLPPGTYLICEVRPDVISYQTFPRTGPICPNSEFPGWSVVLGDGEIREIAFGNVFDELYFEPMALSSAMQAVPQRDGILFRPQHAFLVKEFQVEIYDLNGRVIYRSAWANDSILWKLQDERGQRVARGVYLSVITVRAIDGTLLKARVQKLIVR